MKKKDFLIIIIFFAFIFWFWKEKNLIAQETIGKISNFEGQVELVRKGALVPIKLGMPILSGDRIKTLEGKVQVEFKEGSKLEIRPQSNITIVTGIKKRKIRGKWSKEYLARTIKVDRGEVNAKIIPSEKIKTEFESLAAVAVVKGTTLTYTVNEEGYVIIHSEEGELACNSQDGWVTFTLSSGESIGAYICPPPEEVVLLVCYTGTIEFNVGNTTVTLEAGEQIAAYYNPTTGVVNVASVVGEVEVTSEGTTVTVAEGLGTTCPPEAPPGEPTTPTIDPCYFVEAPPPPMLMAPEPPPPPPTPPASPSE